MLVFLVAFLINIILIKTFIKEVRKWREGISVDKGTALLFFMILFVFLFYLMNFKGPTTNYWDTYITAPAMFIANSKIDFKDIEGKSVYDYELGGRLPNDLVDNEAYGIISKDQRIGAGIFFSLPFLFFNIFGFRLFYALIGVMIATFGFFIGREIFKSEWMGFISSILISLNPFIISVNYLNANLLGLMIISIIIFLLLKRHINWFIIGLLYGIWGGVRNRALFFLPALLFWFYFSKATKKQFLLLFIGALLTISPILFWNHYAFGNMFTHPTQYPALGGYRPTFEHRFLFWNFQFNGLLNYPLYNKIIRTPHFAFPTYLTIPLVLIFCFGVVLFALIFFGIDLLWRDKRRLAIFLLLWLVPSYLFLIVQENWEELKTTFILLVFNPLTIFMAGGIRSLFTKNFKTKLLLLIGICLMLVFFVKISSLIEVEQDLRWYERFPHAVNSESGLNTLTEEYRNDWRFFYTPETKEEYKYQKKKLTQGNLLPMLYTNVNLSMPTLTEINKRDLETLEIWNYIYG